MRRRVFFALLPLLVILGTFEVAGRLWYPDHDQARFYPLFRYQQLLYDPNTPLTQVQADGSLRFVHTEHFRDQSWQRTTPENTFRVIFVGDSTVYGQLPNALAQGLVLPQATVEMLNFGAPGLGSDRVRIVANEAITHDPQLLLVYVGHNELVEQRLNPVSQQPMATRRVRMLFLHTGLARLLYYKQEWMRLSQPPESTLDKSLGVRPEAFGVVQASERDQMQQWYQHNLEGICAAAQQADVPVAFITPVSSLVYPADVEPDTPHGDEIEQRVHELMWWAARGEGAQILPEATALANEHPDIGMAQVPLGLAHVARGNTDKGVRLLQTARDMDMHPQRATDLHATALLAATTTCGATAIDPTPAFMADADYLDATDPLFMDKVHPTAKGNQVLAQAIFEGLKHLLPEGTGYAAERVVLNKVETDAERGWNLRRRPWTELVQPTAKESK